MGWFGSQDLSTKFGMVLGSLVAIVFAAGLIKVWINKRTLAKNIKIEELEKANSTQERLNVEELGEGDLFGVRAIERGFFGGVSQSRSNSPAQSMFGTPSTTVVDLTEASRDIEATRGPSTASSSSSLSRRSSELSVPKSIKHKPSPLRLQPSDAEIRRSAMPNAGGSYIPTVTIKEAQSPSVFESPPIKTHSDDELSQLRYQGEVPRNLKFLAGQHMSIRSQVGSIYSSAESSPNNPANIPKIPTPPAPTHVFGLPPRFPQQLRSTSPEEPSSNDSSPSPNFPVPSIPSSSKNSYQPTTSLEDSDSNTKSRSYQPTQPSESQPEEDANTHYREPSLAFSTLTTRTSILNDPSSPRPRSEQLLNSNLAPRGRPTHGKQYTHSQISRTNDSIRISHKSSQAQGQEHRHSKDRDQIYYDPTSVPSTRNRSGSVQGRAVDFDHPRESPFSNSHAISSGSGSSGESFSSASSVSSGSSRDSSMEGRGRRRSESLGREGEGEREGDERDWNRGRGRSATGETIVEVLTPVKSRGERFDASDLV